ncbi:MAG TPA: FtsX-like permease family protein [Bacteroidales bacterium]|nr:FtsX-like permease family protein [Bacteroidales bacterium]HSA43965.1 FtsX-like permease family protein [Bacteroidales bacterium]
MILVIAWKNIWRSKTRSLVVMAAFALGVFSVVFGAAVMIGLMDRRMYNAIHNEVSHLQVHHPQFADNEDIHLGIRHSDAAADSLARLRGIKSVSTRILVQGMAGTAEKTAGVMICGINPEIEKHVTDIHRVIPHKGGDYLSGDCRGEILIGEKLARELNLAYYSLHDTLPRELLSLAKEKASPALDSLKGIRFVSDKAFEDALNQACGSTLSAKSLYRIKRQSLQYSLRKKVVLTFQSYDGELTGAAFRVCGIFRTKNAMVDGVRVFVNKDEIAELAAIPKGFAHEVAVLLEDGTRPDEVKAAVSGNFPGMLTETWKELQPDVAYMKTMVDNIMYIYLSIILLALVFGLVNTMLMAVLERTRELGMLRAVGMNNKRVFRMIMLETVLLAISGTVAGILIAGILIAWKAKTGIDLSYLYGEGYEAWGFDTFLYPVIRWKEIAEAMMLVILAGVLASVMPARRALRMKPVDALKTE